jgi:hypothetical protein
MGHGVVGGLGCGGGLRGASTADGATAMAAGSARSERATRTRMPSRSISISVNPVSSSSLASSRISS